MLEDRGTGLGIWQRCLALGIEIVAESSVEHLLCCPHLGWVDTTYLNGWLMLPVPNDPWSCLVPQYAGTLLLEVCSEDQQPQHYLELVRSVESLFPPETY